MSGFGHAAFGHYPFGHPTLTPWIQDLAYNPIADPSTGQMLGYTATEATDETLGLEIYKFIFRSIRREDEQGNLFLKRFLEGPQQIWEDIQLKILELQTLWDVTTVDENWLPYLKPIVGWSATYDYITNELTTDQLRRLIASSVALWKSRGNEDSIIDLLTLATGARMRIWNWFDFRWVLDDTILGEAHDGRDPWMIALPSGSAKEEYWSNLRIVDDSSLNQKLVRDIVGLMRAISERFEITYLAFLDLFEVDDDDSQWYDTYQDAATGNPMTVADGAITLDDDTVAESAIVASSEAQGWDNYVSFWRVQVGQIGAAAGMANLLFYATDFINGFSIAIDVPNNRFSLGSIVAGVATYSWHAAMPGGFQADVYYGVRVVVTPVPSTGEVNVALYVDNDELLNETITATYIAGAIGFGHAIDQTITVGEVEVFRLPVDSDEVTINTD